MLHRFFCCLFALTLLGSSLSSAEDSAPSEKAVPLPQPLELAGNWWAYFDVPTDKMQAAIKAFKKSLDETLAGLSKEEHQGIFAKADDVILNLTLLNKKKDEILPTAPPQLQFLKSIPSLRF